MCGKGRPQADPAASRRGWGRGELETRSGIKRSRLRDVVYTPRYSMLVSELEALALSFSIPAADLMARAEQSHPGVTLRLAAKETAEPATEDPDPSP